MLIDEFHMPITCALVAFRRLFLFGLLVRLLACRRFLLTATAAATDCFQKVLFAPDDGGLGPVLKLEAVSGSDQYVRLSTDTSRDDRASFFGKRFGLGAHHTFELSREHNFFALETGHQSFFYGLMCGNQPSMSLQKKLLLVLDDDRHDVVSLC